jgi:hypothetical protein
MSESVFPVLPGLQWPVGRSPQWQTTRRRSASGRRFATSFWSYPVWLYRLSYEFLRRDPTYQELESLAGFFNLMHGGFDTFLYSDPDDNAVAALQFGVGDGVTREFALVRAIGSFSEPIGRTNALNEITINGTPNVLHALIDNRIVNFDTAPANGAVLRWTGTYYMRCAFVDDEPSLEKFMERFWSADGVEFETVKA